jgi:putrescine transport system substrate-binding protein
LRCLPRPGSLRPAATLAARTARDSTLAALRLLVLGAYLAGMITACSVGSEAAPEGGSASAASGTRDSERVLNVYNWGDYMDPEVIQQFEREFGIKVNYDVYDSNELLETRLFIGHTNYDVVVPSAYFLENQIKAGIYQKLDKVALPNLKNLDPEVVRGVAVYDPGNQYAVDYMWLSTTGIAYNVAKIKERMADAPLDSWRMIFDPTVVAKFQDCGVAVLDSPINVVSSALIFLGKDPNSESRADLKAAEQLLLSVREYIRYADSTRLAADLANGEICLALDWSGDIPFAREIAQGTDPKVSLDFSIPKEGSVSNFDVLAIPADAPHPRNAHLFINYLLRPEVAAKNSSLVKYANGVAASTELLSDELRNDPVVYPPAEVRARLVPSRAKTHEFTRLLTRTWTRFKARQ